MIRDRLVCGITNNAVPKLLLREDDLTLTEAIHICEVNELSDQRIKELSTQLEGSDAENMPCERKTEEMLDEENLIKTKSAVVNAEAYMLKVDDNVRLVSYSLCHRTNCVSVPDGCNTKKKILTQLKFALIRRTSMKLYKEKTTL